MHAPSRINIQACVINAKANKVQASQFIILPLLNVYIYTALTLTSYTRICNGEVKAFSEWRAHTTFQKTMSILMRLTMCQAQSCAVLAVPEAQHGALPADVAAGLVPGAFGRYHPVKNRQPHHGLRLQLHPIHKLFQVNFPITAHLPGTTTHSLGMFGRAEEAVCLWNENFPNVVHLSCWQSWQQKIGSRARLVKLDLGCLTHNGFGFPLTSVMQLFSGSTKLPRKGITQVANLLTSKG